MSKFDFSRYDTQDNVKPLSSDVGKKQVVKSGFDFDRYENSETLKDESFLGSVKDYGKTILKGAAEGLGRLGRMIGPLEDNKGRNTSQQLQEQTENLNELLPTDEGFVQKGIRRGLRQAPSMMAFHGAPIQAAVRSGIAGFAGQGVEELGGGEGLQAAAELTAFIGPDLAKKLLSSGKDKQIIDFAKKMGMTDEQITPLIQSDFKQKWLTKLSPKKGSTQEALESTKKGLGNAYETIQKSEGAAKEISEKANGELINSIFEKFSEMPDTVRSVLEKDLQDLLNNKITGRSLINFWKDINANASGQGKQLTLLKEPIKKALNTIDPDVAKDFELVNELYTKFYPISSKLKPTLASDLISAAGSLGSLGAVGSAFFGHFQPMVLILGKMGAEKFAQQLLINPRLQQLSKKMVEALNQNKFGVAKKLTDSFASQIKDQFPELAEKLRTTSEEDFSKSFSDHSQKERK